MKQPTELSYLGKIRKLIQETEQASKFGTRFSYMLMLLSLNAALSVGYFSEAILGVVVFCIFGALSFTVYLFSE